MDLRAVRLFLAVFDARNISAAAERLNMNQPAVSKSIRRMEEDLGVQLFEREPRGVVPTAYAEMLAEVARDIEGNLTNVLRRIDAMRSASEGEVVVGAGGTWQEVILPLAVSELVRRRPLARFRIMPDAPENLVAKLIRGEYDFVLAPIDIPEAMAQKVRTQPLIFNDLAVIGRAGHPLLERPNLSLETLCEAGWALPTGRLVRDRFERGFRRHGMEPPVPMIESPDSSCLFQIVEQTDLLTFVAELRLRSRTHMDLVQMPANPLTLERASGLVTRKSSYMPPLAKELIAVVTSLSEAEQRSDASGGLSPAPSL